MVPSPLPPRRRGPLQAVRPALAPAPILARLSARGRAAARLAACAAALLAGCAGRDYAEAPLPADVLDRAHAERAAAGAALDGPLTLERAVAWVRERSPRVRASLAAYRTAAARAEHATPWPNPRLELGVSDASGADVADDSTGFGAGLGFTIPLSARRERADELDLARALRARAEVEAVFREEVLALRGRWLELVVAHRRVRLAERLVEAAAEALELGDALVAAGQATALDVSLFTLEHARERSRLLAARLAAAEAQAALAALCGVDAAVAERLGAGLGDEALPEPPPAPPPADRLRERATREHPALARLRAEHAIAERALRLEIAEQVPDLEIGPSFDREAGERRTVLGLGLGIEVPLLDRNAKGIAEAEERRAEVRARYEAAALERLADLDRARRALALAIERRELLRAEVLPAARDNEAIARRSLTAGTADALSVLDAERSLRAVELEVLESELALRLAWSRLERAVGAPLLELPGEGSAWRVPPAVAERAERGGAR